MPTGSIGIVGCGTAGQASAILLARAGWHVTILERAPSLDAIGAGLLIQPTGAAVLHELGVLDEIRSLASPVDRLLGTSKAGKVVMDLHYTDLVQGNCGLGVHRGALFNTLQRTVDAAGVETRTGVDVRSIERTNGPCHIADTNGVAHGPYDLVLACDGTASTLRAQSNLVRRDRPYTWAAFWFIGSAADDASRTLRQVFGDTRQLLGLLPTGRLAAHTPELVSLFWSIRADTIDSVMRAGIDAFKDTVRQLTPLADGLLDQMHTMDQLIAAPYRDVVMRTTVDPPIVYLGDAAHAMSPQLGQGANLALMDASALARCLGMD
jgi:2-polyprenyl-6-methoxyphenol hydroxylase-like FAD-dependent oxidoreductase